MADIQKLQYNNRTILNPNRNAYIGFIETINNLNITLNGNSTLPMTYSINGTSFTVNDGNLVSRQLSVGDTLSISATSTSGKTFSIKGLEHFNVTSCTWNHKGNGSVLSLTAILLSGSKDTIDIGFDDYRNKSYTANCAWYPSTDTYNCYNYQPGGWITSLSTNCLQSGYWHGDTFVTDVADFTTKTISSNSNGGGYGKSGWTNYRYDSTPRWSASSVFNYDQVLDWSVTYNVHNISCNANSFEMIIWGTHASGGNNRRLTTVTFTKGNTATYTFTGSGANNKGPHLCVEQGSSSTSTRNMSHEGTFVITGTKR